MKSRSVVLLTSITGWSVVYSCWLCFDAIFHLKTSHASDKTYPCEESSEPRMAVQSNDQPGNPLAHMNEAVCFLFNCHMFAQRAHTADFHNNATYILFKHLWLHFLKQTNIWKSCAGLSTFTLSTADEATPLEITQHKLPDSQHVWLFAT